MAGARKIATRRSVNAALRAAGIPLEFVTTRQGYQYWIYDDGERFETVSEMVCYVRQLSVDQWVDRGGHVVARLLEQRRTK